MSDNIFKAGYFQVNIKETKVIDSNAYVAKRMEALSRLEEESTKDDILTEREESVEGDNTNGLDSLFSDSEDFIATDVSEYEKVQATGDNGGNLISSNIPETCDLIVESARQEAEQIIEEANEEALSIRENASKEGYEAGYEEGKRAAASEAEQMKTELEHARAELEAHYKSILNELEPKMVETITGIYKKVFGDSFYNKTEVIVSLLSRAVLEVGNDEEISIYVSRDDYKLVDSSMHRIIDECALKIEPKLSIMPELEAGEMKIETAEGIIDCGIDTELDELSKTLRVLSYEDSDKHDAIN